MVAMAACGFRSPALRCSPASHQAKQNTNFKYLPCRKQCGDVFCLFPAYPLKSFPNKMFDASVASASTDRLCVRHDGYGYKRRSGGLCLPLPYKRMSAMRQISHFQAWKISHGLAGFWCASNLNLIFIQLDQSIQMVHPIKRKWLRVRMKEKFMKIVKIWRLWTRSESYFKKSDKLVMSLLKL